MKKASTGNGSAQSDQVRKGKFIAVANMKGGVGKTTTVVSLAEGLAADDESAKILVIDLDPQASASVAIAGDELLDEMIEGERTLEAFLDDRLIAKRKADLSKAIHPTVCATSHKGEQLAVALLPCGPRLRSVERELIYELAISKHSLFAADGQMLKLFKTDIMPLAESYDYIIFDCAPGISPVTEIAIRLSDLVIVPTIPDRLSVYGLNAFYENIWQIKTKSLPPPKAKPTILVVRMNRSIRQHVDVLDELRRAVIEVDSGYAMMEAEIPTSAALVAALMMPEYPTFVQKYTQSVISKILTPLVKEVKALL